MVAVVPAPIPVGRLGLERTSRHHPVAPEASLSRAPFYFYLSFTPFLQEFLLVM
jgi:hypothetical protein